jgi:hypothetical protein
LNKTEIKKIITRIKGLEKNCEILLRENDLLKLQFLKVLNITEGEEIKFNEYFRSKEYKPLKESEDNPDLFLKLFEETRTSKKSEGIPLFTDIFKSFNYQSLDKTKAKNLTINYQELKTEATEIDKQETDFAGAILNSINYDKEHKKFTADDFVMKGISEAFTRLKRVYRACAFIVGEDNPTKYLAEELFIILDSIKLETYKPSNAIEQIFFNDKIGNLLHKFTNNVLSIINGTGGSKKGLNNQEIKVMIKNADTTISNPLNNFDRVVLQAIFSITKEKNYFDIQEIKKQLTDEERKRESELDEEIKNSVEKMRITTFSLDIARALNKSYPKQLKDEELESLKEGDYILPIRPTTMKKGGVEVEVYRFIAYPLFFAYEEARGQLIRVDNTMLKIPISNTPDNVMLKNLLAKKVQHIININKKLLESKSGQNLNKINYKTFLIEETNLMTEEEYSDRRFKNKAYMMREKMKTCLNEYKELKKIKDFKEYPKESQIKEGIEIIRL